VRPDPPSPATCAMHRRCTITEEMARSIIRFSCRTGSETRAASSRAESAPRRSLRPNTMAIRRSYTSNSGRCGRFGFRSPSSAPMCCFPEALSRTRPGARAFCYGSWPRSYLTGTRVTCWCLAKKLVDVMFKRRRVRRDLRWRIALVDLQTV
jgi:hypothetical protein